MQFAGVYVHQSYLQGTLVGMFSAKAEDMTFSPGQGHIIISTPVSRLSGIVTIRS